MSNPFKASALETLKQRFGDIRKLEGSESLFILGDDAARVYIRYSKIHPAGRTFFGLRDVDLRQLEGHNSFLCFLLDDGSAPIFIPYSDFEEVFRDAETARDGQYKVQLVRQRQGTELYVARRGRFNIDGYLGFDALAASIDAARLRERREFSHSQVQTLLAGIGHLKGYEVTVPAYDVGTIDWSLTPQFTLCEAAPSGFADVSHILCEVDVMWVAPGSNSIEGLFEVEHTTPVYSGLLRFNDILLTNPKVARFSIVSNDNRRSVFARQLFRPTFRKSGLSEVTSFLEYANVADWHDRLRKGSVERYEQVP